MGIAALNPSYGAWDVSNLRFECEERWVSLCSTRPTDLFFVRFGRAERIE